MPLRDYIQGGDGYGSTSAMYATVHNIVITDFPDAGSTNNLEFRNGVESILKQRPGTLPRVGYLGGVENTDPRVTYPRSLTHLQSALAEPLHTTLLQVSTTTSCYSYENETHLQRESF